MSKKWLDDAQLGRLLSSLSAWERNVVSKLAAGIYDDSDNSWQIFEYNSNGLANFDKLLDVDVVLPCGSRQPHIEIPVLVQKIGDSVIAAPFCMSHPVNTMCKCHQVDTTCVPVTAISCNVGGLISPTDIDFPVTLEGTITPPNATHQNIIWSVVMEPLPKGYFSNYVSVFDGKLEYVNVDPAFHPGVIAVSDGYRDATIIATVINGKCDEDYVQHFPVTLKRHRFATDAVVFPMGYPTSAANIAAGNFTLQLHIEEDGIVGASISGLTVPIGNITTGSTAFTITAPVEFSMTSGQTIVQDMTWKMPAPGYPYWQYTGHTGSSSVFTHIMDNSTRTAKFVKPDGTPDDVITGVSLTGGRAYHIHVSYQSEPIVFEPDNWNYDSAQATYDVIFNV